MITTVIEYIHSHKDRVINDLFDCLRIPSISTNKAHANDVKICADQLCAYLKRIGLQRIACHDTNRHPIVTAEWIQDPSLPTVLIYGHYDVQPADPLDEWQSDPFSPEIRDDFIYARGVADDKGQVFCHLKAIEAWLSVTGTLPVNIKLLIEGEEEIGSPHLAEFITNHKDMLKSTIAVISDTPMFAPNQPAICYSLRGMVYSEIHVEGPSHDLHSGQHGGVLQNPIQALARIISQLKDNHDRVLIPGFYDEVLPISASQKEDLAACDLSLSQLKKECGVTKLLADSKEDVCEKKWFQPTLDCNGITGGYTRPGAKTIIPAKASAKISMRLVANQDPYVINEAFKTYVNSMTPPGVRVSFTDHTHAFPARINIQNQAVKAASKAYEDSYDKKPLFIGEGGTIPVVADFQRLLGIDTVMMGFNLPDDGIHSPNERFGVRNYFKGIETSIRFLSHLAMNHQTGGK